MNEAINIVKSLLAVLPDSVREDPSWLWCWEELGDDAQDEVKAAREKALVWLKKQEGQ